MAGIGKHRRKAAGKKKSAPRRQIIVVGKKRHTSSRRRVSGIGSTSIGATRKKRRKSGGFLGSTSKGSVMQVIEMAAGVGVGAAATHMVLRPIEHKLSAKYPMVTKFMGAAEIVLGGIVALKSNKPFIKAVGVGVLAGGVHTVMKQTHIGLESPAVNGSDGYTTLNVPINGRVQDAIRGLIDNGKNGRYVRTPVVGNGGVGVLKNQSREAVYTPTVGDRDDDYMGTLTEEERDYLYAPRGY